MSEEPTTGRPAEGDAFTLFGKVLEDERALTGKFEGGEHQWLGARGMLAACAQDSSLGPPLRQFKRHARDVALSYGEIVALSGDFYRSAADLFDERPARLPWLYESNDLSDIRKAFRSELAWIEQEKRALGAGYPDNNFVLMWNAKSYVELALDNTDHFGWHNVVAYCRYHAQAMDYAIAARSQGDDDENWRRAIYYNGFADHFLTDGFAAGHVRIPRAEIRDWAKREGYGEKLAGGLSKLLHDQDGHVNTAHAHGESELPDSEGLPVRNARGLDWSTRCDGQLFLVPKELDTPLIAEPVAAVAASLLELGQAFRDKRAPSGVYRALTHVPFPRPGSDGLCQKFPASMSDERVEELIESTAWYVRLPWLGTGLDAKALRHLLQALPELMRSFARHIAAAHDGSSELQARLPEPYVTAFRQIS